LASLPPWTKSSSKTRGYIKFSCYAGVIITRRKMLFDVGPKEDRRDLFDRDKEIGG